MAGVDIGGAALILALGLFPCGARGARAGAHRQGAALARAYMTLLALLSSSVVLATFLAGAIPGQWEDRPRPGVLWKRKCRLDPMVAPSGRGHDAFSEHPDRYGWR